MANYNYIHIHDIIRAVASLEIHESCSIFTSHGDRITYTRFGNEHVNVDREDAHFCCSDMADIIMCSFVRDNMRLKVIKDGHTKWYKYFDLVYVNNKNHLWYRTLRDREDASEVCGKIGFWWNTNCVPDGIEYGVNAL